MLCVTLGSAQTCNAVLLGAQLSRKTGQRLVVTRVLPSLQSPDEAEVTREARRALQRDETRARGAGGLDVELHLLFGPLDEAVARDCLATNAQLVIIGEPDGASASLFSLLVQRLVRSLHVPLLFVRGMAAFDAWRDLAHPLRVLLLIEHTESSRAALSWLTRLSDYGAIEVIAACAPALAANLELTSSEALEGQLLDGLLGAQPSRLKFRLLTAAPTSTERTRELAATHRTELILIGADRHRPEAGASLLHALLTDGATAVGLVPAATHLEQDWQTT